VKPQYSSLEHLSVERRREVSGANNFLGDGLRELLAGLYSDKAHFIYELLQNAEDAGATTVSFELEPDKLRFIHDGTDRFSLADIVAITSIGSTKRDDDAKIGQFGVGFKAVFSYTTRPVITSGEYAFAIEDLFVPVPLSQPRASRTTTFLFPFDREDKPADVALAEVAQGLRDLDETTLLFLQNIKMVQLRFPSGDTGSLVRSEASYPLVNITYRAGSTSTESQWLRLVGDRSLSPVIPEGRTVAAAFRLAEESTRKPGKGKQRALTVEALKRGETCVFFPAPKETSDLKFHIHAPFAPTPSRESIKDVPENAELVRAVGQLIADSLPMLRDDGWLNDGLLSALPVPDDELVAPYDEIYTRIREAFRSQHLTPAIGGGFAPASEMVASPSIFRAALTGRDLEFLTGLLGDYPTNPRWLPERTGRANRFLLGLDVREFGWSELDDIFGVVGSADVDDENEDVDAVGRLWRTWLEAKQASELAALYEMLGAGFESAAFSHSWNLDLFEAPLIQVWIDGKPTLVAKRAAHLPTSKEDRSDGRVTQELAYFDDDEHSQSKARRMAFYSGIGVHRWDDRALVVARLKDYQRRAWPSDQQHFGDLRLFVAFLKSNPSEAALFRDVHFVKVDTPKGSRWGRPDQIYIDAPFQRTGLSELYGLGNRLYPLLSDYRGRVAGIDGLLLALGATGGLRVVAADPWKNASYQRAWNPHGRRWTDQGTKRDWDLPEFPRIVESGDPTMLRALWDLVVQSPGYYARAVFQLNASATSHPMRSQLAARLSGEWILDRDGVLRTPRSMTVEDLPSGWPEPTANSLALALGFGAEARERDEAAQARSQRALEMGIPVAFLDAIDDLDESEREGLFAELIERTQARARFPVSTSANPARRAALVAADAADAPAHASERRLRSVVIGQSQNAELTRQYLREQYTDASGDLHCQLCHDVMPFKVSGAWYFVAVQFVKARARVHHQNALATCAACAALYGLTRTTSDSALLESLFGVGIGAETERVTLRVVLDGKRHELWFTGKHALDLQAALRAQGAARGT